MRRLTVGMKILFHLSCHSRRKHDYVCPPEVTQKGISDKLLMRRSHVSCELAKLEERGYVEAMKKHVKNEARVMNVYFLTPAGEALVRELRREGVLEATGGSGGADDRATSAGRPIDGPCPSTA